MFADPLERLAAVDAIRQLKARYFRCMDTKDWQGFAGVFAPDAQLDMRSEMHDGSGGSGLIEGAASIADFVRSRIDDVETVHHGHTAEIELTSADTARAIWAMEDRLRWPPGSPLAGLHGFGHYHETYRHIDGRWYITSTRLTRLRIDIEPAAAGDGA